MAMATFPVHIPVPKMDIQEISICLGAASVLISSCSGCLGDLHCT